MDFINKWWGTNEHIGVGEIILRAIAMSFIVLILLRVSGMKPFAKGGAIDTIIVILLGAVVARGIVGATPFLSTVAAAVAMILVHKILSMITFHNRALGRAIKGHPVKLYEKGEFLWRNMTKANVTEHDIYEELRIKVHVNSMKDVEEIYLERNGEISFILKQDEQRYKN